MEWSDNGIVLHKFDYNEKIFILSCLTKTHGLRTASIRKDKKTQSLTYIGNIVNISWKARLEEHLGKFSINSAESIYPYIYHDKHKILAVQSICELFKTTLNEREQQKELYLDFEDFIYLIKLTEEGWFKRFVLMEFNLLAKLGFGIDIKNCAVTGSSEDLIYLSPKTGHAVSREGGELYKDKLLSLPKILINNEHEPSTEEILEALKVSQYFFDRHIFPQKGITFPKTRNILQETLQNNIIGSHDSSL